MMDNTIKITILIAPLCGHPIYQKDCYMCRNMRLEAREVLSKVSELNGDTRKGVAVTLEAYKDTGVEG